MFVVLAALAVCRPAKGAEESAASRYVTQSGWRKAFVAGKEVQIYYPRGVDSAPVLRPVVYLHGHSGAPIWGRAAFERVADEHGFVYICPRGGVSWWTDHPHPSFDPTLSAEDFVVERLAPYIRTSLDPRVTTRTLAITGISMGGQGSLRLAFDHPELFPIVVSIAAAIEFDSAFDNWPEIREMYGTREAAQADTATRHVHSSLRPRKICLLADPRDRDWIEGNRQFEKALAEQGIPHECDFKTSKGGHVWGYFDVVAPQMGRFIAKAFEELAPVSGGAVVRSVSLEAGGLRPGE